MPHNLATSSNCFLGDGIVSFSPEKSNQRIKATDENSFGED